MARTPSTMLELGTAAPDFNLPWPGYDTSIGLADCKDKPLLMIFSCNHCPYVLHIIESLAEFGNECLNRGVSVVMVNANDVDNYADDSPDKMVELGKNHSFKFPYLYDQSQDTALAYQAACTPDFFLFNARHELVYRGQYDGSRPNNGVEVTGADLKAAVDALLMGNDQAAEQVPSVGCNIKWKAGNEPDYF